MKKTRVPFTDGIEEDPNTSCRMYVNDWSNRRKFYFSKRDGTLYFGVKTCTCRVCDSRLGNMQALLRSKKVKYKTLDIAFGGHSSVGLAIRLPSCETVRQAIDAFSKASGIRIGPDASH